MAEGRRRFFLRHGRADRDAYQGHDDDLRPLTDEGRALVRREAAFIALLGPGIDTIVTSPLRRAAETAAIVAARLGLDDRLRTDPRLGHAFAMPTLAGLLADLEDDARRIMLVGHEPGFSEVIGELIGGGRVVVKKGALARVDLLPGRGLRGRLIWLLQPPILISGGRDRGDAGPAEG
jgi:phosphohistidine phosphatase